ncbi:hypothetical protein BSZ32_03045 [Rubritalea profundi]|uniref:FeoB-associated Cys-rich membrane protein n=1 Tax=Rubritalea profundi TaxID=1658618 RepID=A0A2S7TZ83_9BACT|nr:hypothetical protein BSZ32_03045 [Rubritalea profundi]
MPSTQTILALCSVALAVAALAYKVYKSLKSSSSCGSCGCNMMSDKAKKKLLQKREVISPKRTSSS